MRLWNPMEFMPTARPCVKASVGRIEMFMVWMCDYFRVVGRIVITKNKMFVNILIMVRIICFDQNQSIFDQHFNKFQ